MMRSPFWLLLPLLLASSSSAQGNRIVDESLESLLDAPVNAASQYLQTAREAPAAVTVISAAEILDFGYRTLADALRNERGFYLNDDLESQYVGTRGFGRPGDLNNRILVLIDGQPQNEAASGYVFLDERLTLNLNLVERIEVVRGPGSTLHGSGAMLAVINVVTREASGDPGTELRAISGSAGELELRAHVAHRYPSGMAVQVWGVAGERDGLDLYFPALDAPATNFGVAERRDWRRFGNIGVQAGHSGFTARVKHMTFSHGSPSARIGRVFNSDATSTEYEGSSIELGMRRDLSPTAQISAVGSANWYTRRVAYPFVFQGDEELLFTDRGSSLWYRGDANLRLDTSPANRVFVGAAFKVADIDYTYRIAGAEQPETSLDFRSASLYVQDEYRLSSGLAMTAGLRYDWYSETRGALAPRFAVVYNATERATVKMLYGGAFRAPNVEEYYAENTMLNLVSNSDIAPEYIDTIEGIWEQEWTEGFVSTVSAFNYRLRDLIELAANNRIGALQYQNLGSAHARGLELSIRARLGDARLFGSLTYQRARDGDSRERLWSSPDVMAKAGASWSAVLPIRLGLQVRAESGRSTARMSDTKPFAVADLTLTSKPLLDHVQFTLNVRNVLDSDYELPGTLSDVQQALPQRGREFMVHGTIRF